MERVQYIPFINWRKQRPSYVCYFLKRGMLITSWDHFPVALKSPLLCIPTTVGLQTSEGFCGLVFRLLFLPGIWMLIGRFMVSVPQRAYRVRPSNGPSSSCDLYGLHVPLCWCVMAKDLILNHDWLQMSHLAISSNVREMNYSSFQCYMGGFILFQYKFWYSWFQGDKLCVL